MHVKSLLIAVAIIAVGATASVAQEKIGTGSSAVNNGRDPNPTTPTYRMQSETTDAGQTAATTGMTQRRASQPGPAGSSRGGTTGAGGAAGGGAGGGAGGPAGGSAR